MNTKRCCLFCVAKGECGLKPNLRRLVTDLVSICRDGRYTAWRIRGRVNCDYWVCSIRPAAPRLGTNHLLKIPDVTERPLSVVEIRAVVIGGSIKLLHPTFFHP